MRAIARDRRMPMRRTVLTRLLIVAIFTLATPGCASARPPASPTRESDESFRVATPNIPRADIAASCWRAPAGKARGTVFMCHGFGRSMWDFRGYRWVTDQEHFNVVRFDFRGHGQSAPGLHLPTLGYYEIYDLKAVIDWAESQGLEKPYVCYGHSMGAAIALRWAGQDPRIQGVLAQSPFRNAESATHQFRPGDVRVRLASGVLVHGGLRRMLRTVDIPTAVAKRHDLMLWLTLGERDYFPQSDQRAILAASPSPPELKKFIVIPKTAHGGQWKWSGNDPLIHSFLSASAARAGRPPLDSSLSIEPFVQPVVVIAVAVAMIVRRRRGVTL
jgi:pimeloyl-ACP methyl ester carboxylesterase